MNYGLSSAVLDDFQKIFQHYPAIKEILIFGSRVKGTAKPSSDIDLAVIAPSMDDQEFSRLWNALDNLPLVFKLDIVHWDKLGDTALKRKIRHEGRLLYPRDC